MASFKIQQLIWADLWCKRLVISILYSYIDFLVLPHLCARKINSFTYQGSYLNFSLFYSELSMILIPSILLGCLPRKIL